MQHFFPEFLEFIPCNAQIPMLAIYPTIHLSLHPSIHPFIQVLLNLQALLGAEGSGAREQFDFTMHPLFSHPQISRMVRHPQLPTWDSGT